jgi:hypothetical protein
MVDGKPRFQILKQGEKHAALVESIPRFFFIGSRMHGDHRHAVDLHGGEMLLNWREPPPFTDWNIRRFPEFPLGLRLQFSAGTDTLKTRAQCRFGSVDVIRGRGRQWRRRLVRI